LGIEKFSSIKAVSGAKYKKNQSLKATIKIIKQGKNISLRFFSGYKKAIMELNVKIKRGKNIKTLMIIILLAISGFR
jgi:hypothetical protein